MDGDQVREPTTSVCLNMIVKNETKVLRRVFASVAPWIDYYVISDTGSSDGTQALISELGKEYNIEGEISEHKWVNFGHNRDHAMQTACAARKVGRHQCTHLLFIDADEELVLPENATTSFPHQLESTVSYSLTKCLGNLEYHVPHLVSIVEDGWQWRGPAHNFLVHVSGPQRRAHLEVPYIQSHVSQGAKSHGVTTQEKYLRDAALLQQELEQNPNDARSQFYLAQSYRDAGPGHEQEAIEHYLKRAQMPNTWVEEIYESYLHAARLLMRVDVSDARIVEWLLRACNAVPRRAEAFYELSTHLRTRMHLPRMALIFANAACSLPQLKSNEALFVERDVYTWKSHDARALALYYSGHFRASALVWLQMLQTNACPPREIARLHKNLEFALTKIEAFAVRVPNKGAVIWMELLQHPALPAQCRARIHSNLDAAVQRLRMAGPPEAQ